MKPAVQSMSIERDGYLATSAQRHGGVSASCGCDAHGNVTNNNCGPRYSPQCNWNQATQSYSCRCK